MAQDWPKDVDLAAFVRDLPDAQFKTALPPPIIVRLDQLTTHLMRTCRDLGDVSQGELLAALVQTAGDSMAMKARVLTYRHAKVHETLLDAKRKTGRHPLPPRRQGRPRRS